MCGFHFFGRKNLVGRNVFQTTLGTRRPKNAEGVNFGVGTQPEVKPWISRRHIPFDGLVFLHLGFASGKKDRLGTKGTP